MHRVQLRSNWYLGPNSRPTKPSPQYREVVPEASEYREVVPEASEYREVVPVRDGFRFGGPLASTMYPGPPCGTSDRPAVPRTRHRIQPLSQYPTNQRSERREFTVKFTVGSTSRRRQTSPPRQAQPPRVTAALACPRTARSAFRWNPTKPRRAAP